MMNNDISCAELKKLLDYSPDTGVFVWRKRRNGVKESLMAGFDEGNGYIRIVINHVNYKAHRLAWLYMTGKWPKGQIDHINHVRDDNRWKNLGEATHKQNQKNRALSPRNTSGVTGVSWGESRGKWCAMIMTDGVHINLGRFAFMDDAVKARKQAETKYGFHPNHGKPSGKTHDS